MISNFFWFTRMVVFGATSMFSIVVLTLGILAMSNGDDTFDSAIFWITTGSLTALTLPLLLYVTIFRVVSLASMIAFEVVWTFLLWVLWVAVGGSAIGVSGLLSSCSRYAQLLTGSDVQGCKESSIITIFGFLTSFFLMIYNLFAFVLCCRRNIDVSDEETESDSDTDDTDVEINDTEIDFDNEVSPTDRKKSPPPYEAHIIPQNTADSYTQADIPYTAAGPQPRAATGLFSRAEDRLYPEQYPPDYETPIDPQEIEDDPYTQADIPYMVASPYYYRQPWAAHRPYYGHSRTVQFSLTETVEPPAVYLMPMPMASRGTVVLIRPPYYG